MDDQTHQARFARVYSPLPFKKRMGVRRAVSRGRAVKDPSLAPAAVALASKWLMSPMIRWPALGVMISLATTAVASVVMVVTKLFHNVALLVVVGIMSAAMTLGFRQTIERSRRLNLALADHTQPDPN